MRHKFRWILIAGGVATGCLVQRPSLALLGAEPFRAALEFAWHKLGKTDDAKPGDGHPVLIFPGLGADGNSVATLRNHCRALGYDAFDWGQGFNTGPRGDLDAWQTCRHDKPSKLVHDIEVSGSHIGMGWNRDVLAAVADRLGQQGGPWRRYLPAQ